MWDWIIHTVVLTKKYYFVLQNNVFLIVLMVVVASPYNRYICLEFDAPIHGEHIGVLYIVCLPFWFEFHCSLIWQICAIAGLFSNGQCV